MTDPIKCQRCGSIKRPIIFPTKTPTGDDIILCSSCLKDVYDDFEKLFKECAIHDWDLIEKFAENNKNKLPTRLLIMRPSFDGSWESIDKITTATLDLLNLTLETSYTLEELDLMFADN